jgi:hypothetical protein
MKKIVLASVFASLFASFGATSVLAQEAVPAATPPGPPPPAPTADEVKKVTEYYLKGVGGGPILMESVLCAKAERVEGKLACLEKLPATIKKGDPIIAYVKFFVPKGGKYEDLKVKFLLNGEVRSTSDFTLTESWTGYANYKQATAQKPGTWEVQVLRGETVLAKHSVIVE